MITVKLFAQYREEHGNEVLIDYYDGITIHKIADELNIDKERLSISLVNGQRINRDEPLQDETTVSLFPLVAGG